MPIFLLGDGPSLSLLKEPGVIAIARHALAPGSGDPDVVDLNDRTTQRNLSKQGEDQARHMGELLREAGIQEARVYTSQWARCRETATLMNIGKVEDLPALNSFFEHPERRASQMAELKKWLQKAPADQPIVLVTHQVVITALTDVFPASGEILLIRADPEKEWRVVHRTTTRPQ